VDVEIAVRRLHRIHPSFAAQRAMQDADRSLSISAGTTAPIAGTVSRAPDEQSANSNFNGRTAAQSLAAEAARSIGHNEQIGPLAIEGHELCLFTEATPMWRSMVDDIRAAKRRVWLETYIYADDDAGRAIADALVDRARAGLDVRLMFDSVGSLTTPAAIFKRLRDGGVKVHEFHTLREALWRFALFRIFNQRNHRKLLVVDDTVAYFGGMNIVDQRDLNSVDDTERRHLPASSGWRDVHVRMVGPRGREIAQAMQQLWRYTEHQRMTRGRRWPIREMLASSEGRMFFFDCRPMFHYRRIQRVLVPLIRRAKHKITISMAYFIPVGRVLRELVRARRRGVHIRVVIPEKSDVRAVQCATRHFYSYLLKKGIKIYERKDRMLHSKAMVIDDEWSVIGSSNLDPRSLRTNLEFVAVFHSCDVAAALLGICKHEMQNSTRVTRRDCERRTCAQRLIDRAAWSIRRLL
jgi:cardiolipin synthase